MQEFVHPDGRVLAAPVISGASLRGKLRRALAWHTVRTLEIPPASQPKLVMDLLASAGSLTGKGSVTDLDRLRRVHELLPALGLLGYSAGSEPVESTLRAGIAQLVCEENRWRGMPEHLKQLPHASMSAGEFQGEELGTRHDIRRTPFARYVDTAFGGNDDKHKVQMVFSTGTILAGAVLWSEFVLLEGTDGHAAALAAGVDCMAPVSRDGQRVMTVGGKSAQGFGSCRLDADLSPLGDIAALRAAYEERLTTNRDACLSLLAEVTGA